MTNEIESINKPVRPIIFKIKFWRSSLSILAVKSVEFFVCINSSPFDLKFTNFSVLTLLRAWFAVRFCVCAAFSDVCFQLVASFQKLLQHRNNEGGQPAL